MHTSFPYNACWTVKLNYNPLDLKTKMNFGMLLVSIRPIDLVSDKFLLNQKVKRACKKKFSQE